jgi:alpha-beta hydrolase superfamily lysophospholipase
VAALWAARRPDRVHALILTSPWLDLHRPEPVAAAATGIVNVLARRMPTRYLPLPDPGLSVRSVHRSFGGEWDYDLQLKASPSPPLRLGWLRAVRAGHARVAAGLGLPMPVLVLLAARGTIAGRWHDDLRSVDTVIDVDQVARRALTLGEHVTVVRVPDAMHDLLLSAEPVRRRALAELARWCSTYG